MADGALLLGVPDRRMTHNDDSICGWSTNKIGGSPNWMFGQPSQSLHCPCCGTQLFLVFQVYCPLTNSPYHRVLYVFGCTQPSCWNLSESWKVLRCQAQDTSFVHDQAVEEKASSLFEVDGWCDDAEDWGDEESTGDPLLTELEHLAGKMSIQAEEPTPGEASSSPITQTNITTTTSSNSSSLPHFEPYYVAVVEEPLESHKDSKSCKHEQRLLAQYQQREGVQLDQLLESAGEGWSGETYEKQPDRGKAPRRFYKTLQLCPEQVLRYQRGGTFASLTTANPSEIRGRVAPCARCGSERVFEMQLMPALVNILKSDGEKNETQKYSDERHVQSSNSVDKNAGQKPERQPSFSDGGQHSHESRGVVEGSPGGFDKGKLMKTLRNSSGVTIEFGTVLVFTCARSCWLDATEGDLFREEFVIVEADPDASSFF